MWVREIDLDVAEAVGLDGRHTLRVWSFAPERAGGPVPLVVCLPGGSYSSSYWHPPLSGVTDMPDYSFAEHLVAAGVAVALVDPFGVGASSRPADGRQVTPERTVAAHAAALPGIVDGFTSDGIRVDAGRVVGVGHSLGGQLTIVQQARHGGFRAIAVLGWSNLGLDRHGAPTEALDEALAAPNGYLSIAREGRLHLFHHEDVEPAVLVAEGRMVERVALPMVATTLVPDVVAKEAAAVDVPVFLAFGERDVSRDPAAEVATYPSSPDITLVRLERSAHCHNFASTRHVLWERLARWVRIEVAA